MVPGGWAPDKLRRYDAVKSLVRGVHEDGKIVGLICHAGLVGISAGIVAGGRATGSLGIKDDLVNAGATVGGRAGVPRREHRVGTRGRRHPRLLPRAGDRDRRHRPVSIRYLDDPPASAEVVIVGGGVIGAAAAFHAARAGLRPLIVEARPRLCTLTTPVAAGAFRLQFDNLEELELVRESVELFLNFEELTGQRDYALPVAQQGYLWLTTSEATAASQRASVAQLHAWGQTDVELLSGDETRARFPWVAPDVVQSRFRAGDGFLDTKRLTFGLVSGAGADVVTSCAVTGFETEGGRLSGRADEPGNDRLWRGRDLRGAAFRPGRRAGGDRASHRDGQPAEADLPRPARGAARRADGDR